MGERARVTRGVGGRAAARCAEELLCGDDVCRRQSRVKQGAQLGMAATSLSPWATSAEQEAELLEMEGEDGWQRWMPLSFHAWLHDDSTEADMEALWRLLVLAVDDETGEERAYGEEEAAA